MGAGQSHPPASRRAERPAAPRQPQALTAAALSRHEAKQEQSLDAEDEGGSESFASWRSGSERGRASQDSQRSVAPMSGPRPSSQWLEGRPSADTPLASPPPAASDAPKRSSLAPSDGAGRRSRSSELMRPSSDSRGGAASDEAVARRPSTEGSASVYSAAGSGRSSFALERASLEANRASLEAFQEAIAIGALAPPPRPPPAAGPELPGAPPGAAASVAAAAGAPPAMALDQLMAAVHLPSSLREKFVRLCVLPPNTPAPASMLGKLWQAEAGEVKAALAALAAKGVLNVAQLPDGRVWCLPQAQQLALLQAACRDVAAGYHRLLLDAYCASVLPRICEEPEGSGTLPPLDAQPPADAPHGAQPAAAAPHGAQPAQQGWQPPVPGAQHLRRSQRLQDVPDDGYVLINAGHHLTAAGRHRQLRELLLDPDWLRRKLAAAGTTAVVADFRRYLLIHNCADLKLVLEAFQLSAAQAVAYPRAPGLLRCLMACRLATAPLSPALQAWLSDQRLRIYADSRQALLGGLPRCLAPLTPSLEQAGGLQRLALRGHAAPVTRVLLTPSGTDAVTAASDGTARVWDLDIGDCVLLLEGHAGPIADMAITSDGSLLLTGSGDGTARAFEMERGQCLRVLAGHTAGINALAMDPWARFVVTASADGTARVWDLSSARAVHTLKTGTAEQGGVLGVALSPCTRFAILGCANGTARMYDVISGQCMGVMTGHQGWVHIVEFLPDGKRAVTASHDGTARVWDLHTGMCRHELRGHDGRINGLAQTADGKLVVTGGEDGTARVWDLRQGSCRRVLKGHKAWVSDVAISPAQDKLVTTSGDGTAMAYSLETGDVLCLMEGHSGPVTAAIITRKSRFAVTVSEDTSVRVWDFAARLVQPPPYHDGRVYCVGGSTAGRVLATCGEDCDARLWDAERGTFLGLLHEHTVPIRWLAFSADGSQLVTASPDRRVLLWDVPALALARVLPVSEGSRIRSFAASTDLSRCVVCKWDSTVVVSDLQTGERVSVLQKWGMRDSATGHTSAVNHVLMTADGSQVVTVSKDCTARVWDAATGDCQHVLSGHTDSVLGGCINAAARMLVTFAFDGSLRLWSLESGRCLSAVRLPDTATHVAISPDGWKVAVALANASVCVFDVEDQQAGRPWEFHSAEITGLQFTADGSELVTTSMDASVCVWDAATGAQTGLFVGDCGLTCCWYDGGLEQLAVGTDRGIVHSLDLGLQPRAMPAAAHASAIELPEQPASAAGSDGAADAPGAPPGPRRGGSDAGDALLEPGEGQAGEEQAWRWQQAEQLAAQQAALFGKPAGLSTEQAAEAAADAPPPPSPAEMEVDAHRSAARSRSPSPPSPRHGGDAFAR